MSINHFSQNLQEATWWHSQPQKPPAHHHHHHQHEQAWINHPYHVHEAAAHGLGFNLNRCGEDDESSELEEQVVGEMNAAYNCIRDQREGAELEKESLFEKPLTPSDVGKLNRLVIPKQHAEKYFPLASKSGDKGLILSFEDESGKCWRFRYSYWSSSQSYVLTKGWSRYVKEKRLDAGDIILFERHRIDMDRLFIGWRRRGEEGFAAAQLRAGGAGTTATSTKSGFYNSATDCTPHQGSAVQSRTAAAGNNSRTLRLFGVNMECQLDESEPSTPDGSSFLSHGLGHQPMYAQPSHYYSPDLHQMDIAFTQDVNLQHMRNRRG